MAYSTPQRSVGLRTLPNPMWNGPNGHTVTRSLVETYTGRFLGPKQASIISLLKHRNNPKVGFMRLTNHPENTSSNTQRADSNIMAPIDTSERLQTANALIESYSALSAEAIIQHLAPEFTHQILPESLQMPARTRDEFAVHAQRITSIFSEFHMIPQTILEDESRNSVVIYAKMVGELNLHLGHWDNECIIMLKMSEDGTKVVEYKEFVDSAKAKLLQEKIGAAMKGGNVLKD
ncbi:hypothetical protein ACMFMG_006032 [Clarireedia jacksonii]